MRFVDGQSDLHTGGAQPIAGRPPEPGTTSASILPSATQGIAPMGVFLDAATSGFSSARPLHELRYKWTFSPGGGYSALPDDHPWGTSKAVAYGPRAAFVFEEPGTHVVTLEVTDGSETSIATREITALDPHSFFWGANTYVISTDGFDGAPTGAIQVSSLMAARLNAQANNRREVRFLFARGQSHDLGGGAGIFASNSFDSLHFAAFGEGVDPVLTGGTIRTEGDAFSGVVVLNDLDIQGTFDPATGSGATGIAVDLYGAASSVVANTRIAGFGTAIQTDSGLDDVYISNCSITACANDAIVLDSGDKLAILGTSILAAPGTDSAQISGGPGCLEGTNPGRVVIWQNAFQSVTDAPCWRWNADGATNVHGLIGACRMEGGSPVLDIAPSNPGGTDREGDLVVERNYLLGGAQTGATGILKLTHGGTTLRNNVAVLPDIAPASGIDAPAFITGEANQTNAANDASPVRIHNNSLIDLRSAATLAVASTEYAEFDPVDFAHWSDLEVSNQLAHSPSLQSPNTPHAPLDETVLFTPREAGVPDISAAIWSPKAKVDNADTATGGLQALDDFSGVLRGPVHEVGAHEVPGALRAFEGGTGNILMQGLAPGLASLSITAPENIAGEYTVDVEALKQGPVLLREPEILGTPDVGNTVSAGPSVIAYDPALGAPVRTYQWLQAGAEIPNAITASHVVSANDALYGLSLVERTVNAGSTQLVTETTFVTEPDFIERPVLVASDAKFKGSFDFGPSSTSRVGIFLSFVFTGNYGRLIDYANGTARLKDPQPFIRLQTLTGGSLYINTAGPLTAGQRVSILATASDPEGTATSYYKIDGDDWQQSNNETGLNFGGGFDLSGSNFSLFKGVEFIHYRTAYYAPSTFMDIDIASVRDMFVNADGSLVDPAPTYTAFGTPFIDIYGPAEDLNAGVNHGSNPDFDTITGSFTNV